MLLVVANDERNSCRLYANAHNSKRKKQLKLQKQTSFSFFLQCFVFFVWCIWISAIVWFKWKICSNCLLACMYVSVRIVFFFPSLFLSQSHFFLINVVIKLCDNVKFARSTLSLLYFNFTRLFHLFRFWC